MSKTSVFSAKTNDRLPGIASDKLIEACSADSEGKALASLDQTQHVKDGGIWYPVDPIWGHGDATVVFVEVAS